LKSTILLFSVFILISLSACSSESEAKDQATSTLDELATLIAAQGEPTAVSTEAPSATPSYTATVTPSITPTFTETPAATHSPTSTLTATVTYTATASPTNTASATATASPSFTSTPTVTETLLVIATAPTGTPTPGTPGVLPSVAPIPAHPTATQFLISAPTLEPTLPPGVFPTNTPRVSPTPTVIPGDHFWFWRPFPRDPNGKVSDAPARGYAFGSAQGGLQIHHGVDIQNPTGTFVQSIGSGKVFYAGPDLTTLFGPKGDFYGNVVVIEHDFLAPDMHPIYSLYGHLSRVSVATGDEVEYGTMIGSVGAEGVAIGPHLHLEIRLGDPYDYNAVYNPELWYLPWEGFGVFAARVVGPDGELIQGVRLELIGRSSFLSGWTYADDTVRSDPYFRENIVIGDIRAGQYDLKVGEARNILYRDVVVIEAGQVTLIEIHLPELPELNQ
jgi:murein DD-endopeptidase MepM/ murein hydrolase activator NlpD